LNKWILKIDDNGNEITVRDVQLVLLDMLKDIDAICVRHDIPYFLNGGSALGAFRHQGFIPWDDDIDIAMMDNDFERFLEVASEALGQDYAIHAYEIDRCYNVCIPGMKIRKKGTYVKEVNQLLKNKCKDSDGLFIDVFVYSNVSNNALVDLPLRLLNMALMPLIVLLENANLNPIVLKSWFKWNAKLYSRICRNSKYIGFDLTWTFKHPLKPFRFLRDDIYPTKRIQFEDGVFPVASNIESYLEVAIGPGFRQLPKNEDRQPKHIIDIVLDGDQP
jgi:lipopolysaccharide cholinephosphotransferase